MAEGKTNMKVFDFINHASIKCELNGITLLTDPWVISNAFGGWYQMPSPHSKDIFNIIDTDDKMGVIVSHGHDDHCDDWFIKQHLLNKTFFCSKFATPGLENRLEKSLGLSTSPIGDGVKFGDFKIRQFINPDFTEYDAVITIESPKFLIIHANDNWHEWPENMTEEISSVVRNYAIDEVFLLIQFGVADCFPVNYVGISNSECLDILSNRFEQYLKATENNMTALGINTMYYYANQSKFNYKQSDLNGKSMYELAQNFCQHRNIKYTQLTPGMEVHSDHKVVVHKNLGANIFKYCLSSLQNFINNNHQAALKTSEFIPVRFLTPEDKITKDAICYIADIEVWNRILIGELNLEAIIIGGSGLVAKPDLNIRSHHIFVSKRAYIAQNMIKRNGLSFFREHHTTGPL